MKTKFSALLMALLAVGAVSSAFAATEADVERSFFPYKSGVPTFPGLNEGTVVSSKNVDQFKDVVDPALFDMIKRGWLDVTVGKTTSFDMNKAYVEATRANLNKTKLGAKPGEIEGFVAGRPFPEEPSASDPRAGEKIMWNYKYGVNWGDNAAIYPFYWKYRDMTSGKLEKTLKLNLHFLNFTHRIQDEPKPEVTPNPSKLFRGIYMNIMEPQDLKGTQLLIQRYEDDLKSDDAYLYLGFQRRVRRLATGQVTDSFLGADIMIQDFEGYNDRLSAYKWKYVATKNVLMPYYYHNQLKLATDMPAEADGYKYVDFGGQGNCFQNITWQLRKVYVVEGTPVDASPISKRLLYLDAQANNINRSVIYDKKGEIWKTFTIGKSHPDAHLPVNKGSGIPIDDSFSMVDLQAKHCTTGQFKGQVDVKLNPPRMFQVQFMRGGD
jgi:Protein of unknown function (DUF1329)